MANIPEQLSPPAPIFAPGKLGLSGVLLLLAYGLLVLIPGILPSTRTLSSHEVLAAQPAREMLSASHWIIPTYLEVPRLEKPPTTGWLIAISMAIFRTDAEWAVRLPSLLSALLCTLVVAALATRWLGWTAGILTGAIQLTTLWLQTQANLAEADMLLTAFIAAALGVFALCQVDHPSGKWQSPWGKRAFLALAGVAYLFKGPVALLFIFGACFLYLLLRRNWKGFAFFLDIPGLVLFIALLVIWPLAAWRQYPPIVDMWYQEIFGYTKDDTFGRSPFWHYLANVPLMLMPWFLLGIPAAVVATWRQKLWRHPFALFLASWFIPGMCLLQAAAYKSNHYTFPLLPPLSIVMAAGLLLWLRRQHSPKPCISPAILASLIALASLLGITLLQIWQPGLPSATPLVLIIISAGLLVVLFFEYHKLLTLELLALFLTVAIFIVMVDIRILPEIPGSRARLDFARQINDHLTRGQTLYLVGFSTDEITWYLRDPLKRIDEVKDFAGVALPPEGGYVLTRTAALDDLGKYYRVQKLFTISVPANADLKEAQKKRPWLVKATAK